VDNILQGNFSNRVSYHKDHDTGALERQKEACGHGSSVVTDEGEVEDLEQLVQGMGEENGWNSAGHDSDDAGGIGRGSMDDKEEQEEQEQEDEGEALEERAIDVHLS